MGKPNIYHDLTKYPCHGAMTGIRKVIGGLGKPNIHPDLVKYLSWHP